MKAEPDERYVIGGNMVMKKEEAGYTIRDIEALPDNEREELIDGKIYWMATPTTTHQRILNFLNFEFYRYVKEKQVDCEVFISPFAVYLNETSTYVEPAMNRVQVYDLAKDNLREYTLMDRVPVGIYGGELVIDFSER